MFGHKRFFSYCKSHLLLIGIIFFGGLIRIIGLNYGLPLWLVGDETSHIFGALKMIELKTLLPVLHAADFGNTFYYTPYLSYLYLVPFCISAAVKFLFFHGTFFQYKNILVADPSIFFVFARFVSALFGIATIYLVYSSAKRIFQENKIALLSSLFLAFSLLHVSYSHWARHWTVVTFFYAVGINILANKEISLAKKYLTMAFLVGIGIGVNVQMTIFSVFILIWYITFDYLPLVKLLKQKWFWQAWGVLLFFLGLGFVIWPKGYGFFSNLGNIYSVGTASKNLYSLINIYKYYFSAFVIAEPVFLFFIIIGVAMLIWRNWRKAMPLVGFPLLYLIIFFLFFFPVDRYILPLYPLLAIIAGYGMHIILNKIPSRLINNLFVALITLALIIPPLRFTYLLVKNDSRVQAINWVENNLPSNSKIFVLAPLTRMPTKKQALEEQMSIGADSLRSVDRAEISLDGYGINKKNFHALNLYNINDANFFKNIKQYAKNNQYRYIIYNPSFAKEKGMNLSEADLRKVASFGGSYEPCVKYQHEPPPDGYGEGIKGIFSYQNLGPGIVIASIDI